MKRSDCGLFGAASRSESGLIDASTISRLLQQGSRARIIHDDATISNDELFVDPPPREDCPICMLIMPISPGSCGVQTSYQSCCGKMLCGGCVVAAYNKIEKGEMKELCAFCRVPPGLSNKEEIARLKKRMKFKDAVAFYELGMAYTSGKWGLPMDMNKTLELWNGAADLGSISAHYSMVVHYQSSDMRKAVHHCKIAAIKGHERARYYLGCGERDNGNMDLAIKHWMIAAKSGEDESLKEVGKGYKVGLVTKDEYTKALRAYQETQSGMKSKERVKAAEHAKSRRESGRRALHSH